MIYDPTPEQITDWYRRTEFGNINWEELMKKPFQRIKLDSREDKSLQPSISHQPDGSRKVQGTDQEAPKDFSVAVRVIDRFMKKPGSKEKVSWIEQTRADGFKNDTEAGLGVLVALAKYWPPRQYDLELISVEEALIQKPHLIIPE